MSSEPDQVTPVNAALREDLLQTVVRFIGYGLNQGMSGNLSVRTPEGFLITPSGLPYEQMRSADLVQMDVEGTATGDLLPSSEWRFHLDIYRVRPDVSAVVHTHSTAATALACLERGVPAFHYMVAVAGGRDIRCSPYATFGTQALSDHAIAALTERKACLLGHHGVIAAGANTTQALSVAVEVENLAQMYLACLAVGEPALLDDDQMDEVLAKFANYGQPRPGD